MSTSRVSRAAAPPALLVTVLSAVLLGGWRLALPEPTGATS